MNAEMHCVSAIDADLRSQMWAVFVNSFPDARRDCFDADIDGKTHAVLCRSHGNVVGFTTLECYQYGSLNIVYSGDTVMMDGHWHSVAMARTWIRSIEEWRRDRCGEWYWLLICSGFRTYRFLTIYTRRHVPRHGDRDWLRLRDELAGVRWGHRFDRDRDIVELDTRQRLRADLVDIPAGKRDDPDVRYFIDRNPGHADGDELVCLTRLHPDNYSPLALRLLDRERVAR